MFIPFIGGVLQLFIPAAAVVLGFLGKAKEPFAPKGLWLTGVILGFVGIGIALMQALSGDDPTALVGLPLIQTAQLLREAGLDPLLS